MICPLFVIPASFDPFPRKFGARCIFYGIIRYRYLETMIMDHADGNPRQNRQPVIRKYIFHVFRLLPMLIDREAYLSNI